MPLLRGNREGKITRWNLALRYERNVKRGGIADGFRKQADHVVEIGGGPQAAVVPGGVGSSATHGGARLVLGDEAAVHCRTDEVEFHHRERIEIVVERIAEGGREQNGAGRARLVMVIDDLREP